MSVLNAVILGIVQGVAEFLPISSSGHLSVLQNLFNMSTAENGHLLFDVMLHLGTFVSVCIVYWQDIVNIFFEVISFANLGPLAGQRKAHYPAARFFLLLVVASLPMFLVLPINDKIEELYYHSIFVGIAFILTGCILYVSDKLLQGNKTERNMGFLDAVIIGLCQVVSTIPGLSRSGTTITAGLATGLKREFALKFAFLLSLPAILAANLLTFIEALKQGVEWRYFPAYLIGTAVSLIVGVASITLLKKISERGKFGKFSYYCWTVGALTIILSLIFG